MILTNELGQAILRQMRRRKLSLRDVADETGVSASTISRLTNGVGMPDADTYAALCRWLRSPVGRFLENDGDYIVWAADQETIEKICDLINRDPELREASKAVFADVFSRVYDGMRKQ